MNRNTSTRTLTVCAMLVAVEVILSRFFSIPTPIVKIGFDFAPMALAGMLFGPFWGAAVGMSADFIGAQLFPIGDYFFGFTLTAGLSGLTYGLLLHNSAGGGWREPVFRIRTLLAVLVVAIPLQLLLNTYWLSVLYGYGFLGMIPARILKQAVMIPVQYFVIQGLSQLALRLEGNMENVA